MNVVRQGTSAFRYLEVVLDPGETIVAESDAMSTMDAQIDMETELFGGFFSGLARKFLGGESLFVNRFTNNTSTPRSVHVTSAAPGDMMEIPIPEEGIFLQPGSFVCATPYTDFSVKFGGFSFIVAREGIFKILAHGEGSVWVGSYGEIFEHYVDGQFIVDTGHLVGYAPSLKMKTRMSGGVMSSILGGEGLVSLFEGRGKVYLQTRNVAALAQWLNPHL